MTTSLTDYKGNRIIKKNFSEVMIRSFFQFHDRIEYFLQVQQKFRNEFFDLKNHIYQEVEFFIKLEVTNIRRINDVSIIYRHEKPFPELMRISSRYDSVLLPYKAKPLYR